MIYLTDIICRFAATKIKHWFICHACFFKLSTDATFAFNLCDHGGFGFADKIFDVLPFVFYA